MPRRPPARPNGPSGGVRGPIDPGWVTLLPMDSSALDPASALGEVLRTHGLRATKARLLVMAAIRDLDHPTLDALHQATAPQGVVLTTVYRTLETLEDAALIWAVHVPGTGRTYHPGSQQPHAHLLCRTCGTLDDLAPLPASTLSGCGVPNDFAVEHVHLTVIGRCARCARAATEAATGSATESATSTAGQP
jgi:Fur family ferric uptake transcriptional regulator